MAAEFGVVNHLLPPTYKRMVSAWLEEDCPSFDYGGFVVGEEVQEARLLGKSLGMLAGVPFFDEVFRQLDCTYVPPFFLSSISSNGPPTYLPQRRTPSIWRLTSKYRVEWHIHEGEAFTPVKHCATVRGPIRKILLGERVALNTLARCSGIATK
ncbi:MAG: hypothetical protein Q9212_004649 [Teloschistes hypoglaucus]